MVADWWNLTTDAVSQSLRDVAGYVPEVIGAVVVILLGVLVGWTLKTVVVKALRFIKVKPYTEAIGLNKVFKTKEDLVELLGDLVKWITIIVFLIPALDILGLAGVNDIVKGLVAYLPHVLVAAVILMVGAVLADLASRAVEATAQTIGAKTAAVVADITRWAIIVFAILVALSQLGIATEIINTLITGVVVLIAIAGGLAFGLGGQDAARDVIERLRKNLK
ncbi:MAG: hypothetical protein PHW75_00735 [Patescibacteria group bacterium]|nr:hypothetical protein [Patescibacteria group bacterium]